MHPAMTALLDYNAADTGAYCEDLLSGPAHTTTQEHRGSPIRESPFCNIASHYACNANKDVS